MCTTNSQPRPRSRATRRTRTYAPALVACVGCLPGCFNHLTNKAESRTIIAVDHDTPHDTQVLSRVAEHLRSQGYQVSRGPSGLRAVKPETRNEPRISEVELHVSLTRTDDRFDLDVQGRTPWGMRWQHERLLPPWEANAAAEIRTRIRAIEDIVSLPRFN